MAGYTKIGLLMAVLATVICQAVVLARSRSEGSDRPIIRANISAPFSVAPQPLPETPEVAHARQQFLKTFALIEDAVKAADPAHQPLISARGDVQNNLDLSTNTIPMKNTSAIMSASGAGQPTPTVENPTPFSTRVGPINQINNIIEQAIDDRAYIFPDEDAEPEYFLPRMKVDPLMLQNLDTPLPPNSYIQQFNPIGLGANGGMCYEIVILEPESTFNGSPFNLAKSTGRSGSRPTLSLDNSTTASADTQHQDNSALTQNLIFNTAVTQGGGLPFIRPHDLVGTPVLSSLAASRGGSVEGSSSSGRIPDTHNAVLQAVAATLNTNKASAAGGRQLPPHFVSPQSPFISFFNNRG